MAGRFVAERRHHDITQEALCLVEHIMGLVSKLIFCLLMTDTLSVSSKSDERGGVLEKLLFSIAIIAGTGNLQ